jgi:hypothetical protein
MKWVLLKKVLCGDVMIDIGLRRNGMTERL